MTDHFTTPIIIPMHRATHHAHGELLYLLIPLGTRILQITGD